MSAAAGRAAGPPAQIAAALRRIQRADGTEGHAGTSSPSTGCNAA